MRVRMKKSHSRLFIGVGILLLLALMYGVQTASSRQELDGDGIFEIPIAGYSTMHCISPVGVSSSGESPWHCYPGSVFHTRWQDSDSYYIDDFAEEPCYFTDYDNPDSDNDGYGDSIEMLANTDSADPFDHPAYSSPSIDVVGAIPYEVAWTGSVYNDSHILIFGGENSGGRIDSIMVYDIEKNTSSVLSVVFGSGITRTTAEYHNGKAYVFGGDSGTILDTIYVYDLNSGTLSLSGTHLPESAKEIGSATDGTYIYLFGGYGFSPERKATILRFDPSTEEIAYTGVNLPEGLSQTTPVWGGDAVYIFGGHRYGGSAHQYILKYDPSLNICNQISTLMPREISSMSAVWDRNDRIFIFGGALDGYAGNTHYDTIYVFNTTSETVTEHNLTLPVPSIFHMAEWVSERAYVFGGMTQSGDFLDDIVSFYPGNYTPPPEDETSPIIDSPEDISYELGSTGHNVTWNPYDENPGYYTLYLNGTEIESKPWNGEAISVNVDGMWLGWYNYTIVVGDINDLQTNDTVLVQVVDTTCPTLNSPEDMVYESGTVGHEVNWTPYDLDPSHYTVYMNSSVDESGVWNGSAIVIVVDELNPGTYNYTLIVSDTSGNSEKDTVLVQSADTTCPTTSSPPDIQYEAGSIGVSLSWTVYDLYPASYQVLRNGTLIDSGEWDNSSIAVDVGGLEPGTYNYTLIVSDVVSNTANDTALVTCEDTTKPFIGSPPDIEYEAGTTGNHLTWIVADLYPWLYQITRNGAIIDSGTWSSQNISIGVDGLDPACYNYTLTTLDLYENSRSDSVLLLVSDTTTPTMNHPPDRHIEAGTTGISVVWITFDLYPGSFQILNNGSTMRSGCWNMSVLEVPLDGLGIGTHNITLMLLDMNGNLAEDTVMVFVSDVSPPIINHPSDIVYNYTDTGHSITWMPIDLYPSSFKVLCNGTVILDSGWNGSSITVSVDGLELGRFNFTILVKDTSSNSVTDEVWVTVIVHPLVIDPIMAGLVIGGTFAIVIIVLYVRRWR